ncbi:MAG TPA: proline dehydrogenase family protein [Blastocatellia bacterium]|nr:proline dehydrogenase family protein [Blastocatellia bacterium]
MSLSKSALLYLSRQEGLRDVASRSSTFQKITKRFVAGETLEEALGAIRDLNSKGITASFDHLGESIKSASEADGEVTEYNRILQTIDRERLHSNVSVKLTQLGLDIDPEICYQNTRKIVETARSFENFVRIDMEDSAHTGTTLEVFRRLRAEFDNVGIVVQAYLYRTEKDVEDLLKIGARIRLCKGAYKEPASVAFPKKEDVDQNYVKLMKMLLPSNIYHGIATHDPAMIEATKKFAGENNIGKGRFEFQMLFGIRRDLQESLIKEGYGLRVYVPYGNAWYPYFMRRLAERPANVWFILKNFFKG